MNTLSWLLYLADVAGELNAGAILWLIIGGVLSIFWAACWLDEYGSIEGFPIKRLVTSFVAAVVIAVAVPSQKTLYLIAASEMGEEALKTETAEKIKGYLDNLLEGEDDE